MMRRRLALLTIFAALVVTQLSALGTAQAISTSGFDPGRIIDDALFYDSAGMKNVAEVQAFLDAHVPTCDTRGIQPSGYGSLSNAQYAQQVKGWPGPPYVCLDNYHENPTNGETSFEKGGGAFSGGLSAAQIIYDSAQKYKINPKVLLVLLRKESLNLFSDSWPLKSQYKYAMGYACPDSGPGYSANCQESKAGFYNQVNYSAWQLRYYYDNMGSYNYAPGRWNTIQYNPDPACGTKEVYIQNSATASLYIYTPYTPNDAALNAYPGTAHCGAYGNRNFWFFWQEWFGSTLVNSNFLRSTDNATVYLVGDNIKYPIANPALLSAASVLDGVGYVSQTYLDSIPTGPLLGRTIRSPDGTVYFYDSNIKLPFTTCAMVEEFGSTCGGAALLTRAQIDRFTTGPSVANGMKTTSGRTYFITGGVKREILDPQSLELAGLSTSFNVLTDSAFSHIASGPPYIRNNVIIQSRQNSKQIITSIGNAVYTITPSQYSSKALATLPTLKLDSQSIDKLPAPTSVLNDIFKDEKGQTYVITLDGKKLIPDAMSFGSSQQQLTAEFISKLKGDGSLSNPSLIKSTTDATVYAVINGQKRPLTTMEDLKSITGESSPYIGWTSELVTGSLPTGNTVLGAGRLIKSPSNATVYTTDGYDQLIPLSSFTPASDIGLRMQTRVVSDSILQKYTVDNNARLSNYITCDNKNYLGINGNIYEFNLPNKSATIISRETCNVLSRAGQVPRFLIDSAGTIYERVDLTLHPIRSMVIYSSLKKEGDVLAAASEDVIRYFLKGSYR